VLGNVSLGPCSFSSLLSLGLGLSGFAWLLLVLRLFLADPPSLSFGSCALGLISGHEHCSNGQEVVSEVVSLVPDVTIVLPHLLLLGGGDVGLIGRMVLLTKTHEFGAALGKDVPQQVEPEPAESVRVGHHNRSDSAREYSVHQM